MHQRGALKVNKRHISASPPTLSFHTWPPKQHTNLKSSKTLYFKSLWTFSLEPHLNMCARVSVVHITMLGRNSSQNPRFGFYYGSEVTVFSLVQFTLLRSFYTYSTFRTLRYDTIRIRSGFSLPLYKTIKSILFHFLFYIASDYNRSYLRLPLEQVYTFFFY